MEHFNPILGQETAGQRFITCGEIMLRLTRSKSTRLNSSHTFRSRMPSAA